jgi:hypothetical protein
VLDFTAVFGFPGPVAVVLPEAEKPTLVRGFTGALLTLSCESSSLPFDDTLSCESAVM